MDGCRGGNNGWKHYRAATDVTKNLICRRRRRQTQFISRRRIMQVFRLGEQEIRKVILSKPLGRLVRRTGVAVLHEEAWKVVLMEEVVMVASSLTDLREVFSQVTDPRKARGVRHPFEGIVSLVFLGLLSRITEMASSSSSGFPRGKGNSLLSSP